jgi:paired amphipathic helix protein Sin3a
MLECEDNRYEMDMLISWFSSAVEYAEELEKGIDDNEMEKGNRNFYGVLNVYMVIRVLRYFTY